MVAPAVAALQSAVTSLEGANLQAAQGFSDAGRWMAPIAWMGAGWLFAWQTLVTATLLLVSLACAIAAYRIYLALKEGVKWW